MAVVLQHWELRHHQQVGLELLVAAVTQSGIRILMRIVIVILSNSVGVSAVEEKNYNSCEALILLFMMAAGVFISRGEPKVAEKDMLRFAEMMS